jgi:hypothetical protein
MDASRLKVLNTGGVTALREYFEARVAMALRGLEQAEDMNAVCREQGALNECRTMLRLLDHIRKPLETE